MSQIRRRHIGGNSKLYDAEVEYLLGNSGTWIDTGICPTTNNAQVYADFELTGGGSANRAIFGNFTVESPYGIQKGWSFYHRFGSGEWGACGPNEIGNTSIVPTLSQRYEVFTGPNNKCLLKKYGDEETIWQKQSSIYSSFSTGNIGIFCMGLSPAFFTNGRLKHECSAKIYHLTITVNGVLVRDFIPVRVKAVGYMYDRVTKQLFGNNGPDNFTIGNDI